MREDLPPISEPSSEGVWPYPSIPGYDIVELLGRGGMGVVYKAWQRSPRRLVAVKVLGSGGFATEVQRRRFEREAQAAADLSHAGIVTIYEFGHSAGAH